MILSAIANGDNLLFWQNSHTHPNASDISAAIICLFTKFGPLNTHMNAWTENTNTEIRCDQNTWRGLLCRTSHAHSW